MGENKKIYLSKEGYEQYLKEIEELKKSLLENGKHKSYAYENSGDGFHDNFEFEQSELKERGILYQLREKVAGLDNIVVIEKQKNDEVIGVDDIVSLTIDFGDGDKETSIYKLVGSNSLNHDDEIQNISINSPLGQAIYLKHVGEETSYVVNRNFYIVRINEKINENKKVMK